MQYIHSDGQNVGNERCCSRSAWLQFQSKHYHPMGPGLPLTPLRCLVCELIWAILYFFYLTLEGYALLSCSCKSEDSDVFFALIHCVTLGAVPHHSCFAYRSLLTRYFGSVDAIVLPSFSPFPSAGTCMAMEGSTTSSTPTCSSPLAAPDHDEYDEHNMWHYQTHSERIHDRRLVGQSSHEKYERYQKATPEPREVLRVVVQQNHSARRDSSRSHVLARGNSSWPNESAREKTRRNL